MFLSLSPCAYSMPGTGHALIPGEASTNTLRQYRYVDTVMRKLKDQHSMNVALPSGSPITNTEALKTNPVVFISDTDSIHFVIDTGANRLITNDANNPRLQANYRKCERYKWFTSPYEGHW